MSILRCSFKMCIAEVIHWHRITCPVAARMRCGFPVRSVLNALGSLILACIGILRPCPADDGFPAVPQETPRVELRLRAAEVPEPVLKYRLTRYVSERKPGNAVPYYYRAIQQEREIQRHETPEAIKQRDAWLTKKPLELPVTEVREWLRRRRTVLDELRTAVSRERCDWDLRIQDLTGRDGISFLMAEFQEARTLGRILELDVRLAIAEGRFADAIASIRDGFQLATDIDRSMPILIADLIGSAIGSMMRECLIDLITADGAPNMYWALQTLPPQMFEFASSMDVELDWPVRFIPFLRDAETAEHSPEEWSRLLTEAVREVHQIEHSSGGGSEIDAVTYRLMATGIAIRTYPLAKRELTAAGFAPGRLEQMPVAHVVAVFAARCHRHAHDEIQKWTHVPYPEARVGLERTMSTLIDQRYLAAPLPERDPLLIDTLLYPAVVNVRTAFANGERSHAALLVIEAVRLHMAQNNGQLPKHLADITSVPVPLNPATAKAFPYRAEGNRAELYVPPADERVHQNGRLYVFMTE